MCSWRQNSTVSTGQFRENKTSRGGFSEAEFFGQSLIVNWMGNTSYGASLLGATAEAVIYTGVLLDADMNNLYDNYFKPRWSLP
jgi:hypothetical protein